MNGNGQGGTHLPRLHTLRALAERWGVREGTLRKWARENRVPAFKLTQGRRAEWYFAEDALLEWLETRRAAR